MTDFQRLFQEQMQDSPRFVRLLCKGNISPALRWRQVTVRPLMLKDRPHWQFSRLTERQDFSQNLPLEACAEALAELFALPFSSFQLVMTDETLTAQVSKKGKVILHRHAQAAAPERSHDASKDLPIPPDQHHPLLERIGLMTADGRIKAGMNAKFTQMNEFIKLFIHTGILDQLPEGRPLRILDCGCGSAYLTFGLYHYLHHLRGLAVELQGVDVNAEVIAKSNATQAALSLDGVCFFAAPIAGFNPAAPPDVVVALHACDTASDDALALGVRAGARLILAAPCCHHHLQRQMENTVEPFPPLLRHGILKKRMGDLLTDTFRALLLRWQGYKTDVVEFVAADHTDRNLMIRAVQRGAAGDAAAWAEYQALKAFWGVAPYLETLLGEQPPLTA